MTRTERRYQTLSESLAELERTDPAVAKAAANYDAMVRRLTGNETRAEKRRRERREQKR